MSADDIYKARTAVGCVLIAVLAACGGGGGGGGDSGGTNPIVPVVPVSYTGATTRATLSGVNASKLTDNIFGSGGTAELGGGVAGVSVSVQPPPAESGGLAGLGRRLDRALRATPLAAAQPPGSPRSGVTSVDRPQACDSGSTRIIGTINDNGTGSLTFTFNACRQGADTLNGQATAQVAAYDAASDTITDFTMSFTRLSFTGPGLSVDFGGSLRIQTAPAINSEVITENFTVQDNLTGNMLKADNLILVNVSDSVGSWTSEWINGRIYDKTEGYVDITTTAPFISGTLTQAFPDTGELVFNDAVRVTALSSTRVAIALDLNRDGAYENTATLKWSDLTGAVGADLRDNDGDGMHNSWETANGLDPNNAGDADLDRDGDGFSNKAEYLAGTDPRDAASKPVPVALSLSINAGASPIAVGSNVSYQVVIFNSSANAASNVMFVNTLPPGLTFVSAFGTGACSGSVTVVCKLSTLASFGSAFTTLVARADAPGIVHNTMKVSTASYEPNRVDNTATATTVVGSALGGIQAMIDAAASGDTVTVSPGTYLGGLDFHGKNITLQSRDGPGSTILAGGGSVVTMGPGGTLKGFTISGGAAQIGAGVDVIGSGSLITGNVFDGNAQGGGGAGAAVGGFNGSSPTIEANIFRNNSCDLQSTSGVVAFFNSSFPIIVNNVFENNACRAVNLGAYPEGTFQVINNTFVGNWTGIRLFGGMALSTQLYRNNILVGNGAGLEMEFGDLFNTSVWTNNLVFGNATDYAGPANQTGANGNISADPMFVIQTAGEYHLRPGSPAIDAGSALQAPTVDFDGLPRNVPDIGAFEFLGGTISDQ